MSAAKTHGPRAPRHVPRGACDGPDGCGAPNVARNRHGKPHAGHLAGRAHREALAKRNATQARSAQLTAERAMRWAADHPTDASVTEAWAACTDLEVMLCLAVYCLAWRRDEAETRAARVDLVERITADAWRVALAASHMVIAADARDDRSLSAEGENLDVMFRLAAGAAAFEARWQVQRASTPLPRRPEAQSAAVEARETLNMVKRAARNTLYALWFDAYGRATLPIPGLRVFAGNAAEEAGARRIADEVRRACPAERLCAWLASAPTGYTP